jgi:nitrile hydratase beta subunit
MKLQHSLGGLQGLGPVDFQKNVFVHEWEKRIFAIHTAMMALSSHLSASLPNYPIDSVPTSFKDIWTWADLRRGAESMQPVEYFKFRYYEKWLGGITGFFLEKGYITKDELEADMALYLRDGNVHPAALPNHEQPAIDEQVLRYLVEGDSGRRPRSEAQRFTVGDMVTIDDPACSDHTRLPGYLRNKKGVIDVVYPDSYAYFPGPSDRLQTPQISYSVKFKAADIWGEQMSEPGCFIYADIFECYLK